ncbi:MAG: hypothetical protein PHS64_07990 [Candidatus Omnitrophica bacterium]|nr:hypothetical protein [Candidatus Omnitrophota bacterium]
MKKFVTVLMVVFFLAGCSQGMNRKIDATSADKLKESMSLIKQECKPEEYKKFEIAYEMMIFKNVGGDTDNIFTSMARFSEAMAKMSDPKMFAELFSHINGKTPKQVIGMANEKLDENIKVLEKKKVSAEASRVVLEKISTTNAKYYAIKTSFMSQPVVEFTITNNTGKALSWIDCHGTVTSPGRSVPWISEDFNYKISGGLENGESKHLKLSPNMFSSWGNNEAHARNDLVLNIIINNAKDASDNKLAEDFGENDQANLKGLIEKRNKIKM